MPLQHFLEKYGVDISTIQKIVCGRKYSAVLLKNGNIGVCANLQNHVTVEIDDLKTPDLDKTEHRILLNAYYNATLNYSNRYEQSVDIFDGVDLPALWMKFQRKRAVFDCFAHPFTSDGKSRFICHSFSFDWCIRYDPYIHGLTGLVHTSC